MSLPAILDFDALLAPISESHPCGVSLESAENHDLGNAFSELRTLTSIARSYEKRRYEQGAGEAQSSDSSLPRWDRIADLAIEILSRHSKDARALVSLIESLSHLHSLTGMRDAFKATALIIDKYQLALFPSTEPGETKHYCLEFIGKLCESETYHLKSAIYRAEIFAERPGFNWASHIAATSLERRPPRDREEEVQNGALTLDNFTSALRDVSQASTLNEFDTNITEALTEARNLDALLTTHSDRRVGITRMIDDLVSLQRWYRGLIEDRLKELAPTAEEQAEAPETPSPTEGEPAAKNQVSKSISSREQALASLLQVAAFFRKTEPHSPLSYALEQAVRWGKMPLPELLRDLVSNESVLAEVYQRMGIQEKPDKSDE